MSQRIEKRGAPGHSSADGPGGGPDEGGRTTGTARDLQERAARALPAEHVEQAGGWWLRHAPDSSWWVGTVLPHGGGDLARRIAAAEAFYTGRGAVARFQITPGACPAGLDAVLAERGYRRQSPVSLRVAPTERVHASTQALETKPLDQDPEAKALPRFGELCGYHYRVAAPR